jgi:hypothetical protein
MSMLRTSDRAQRRGTVHQHRPRQQTAVLHPGLPPSRLPTPTSPNRRKHTPPTLRWARTPTHPRTTRWGQIRPSPWGQIRLTLPGRSRPLTGTSESASFHARQRNSRRHPRWTTIVEKFWKPNSHKCLACKSTLDNLARERSNFRYTTTVITQGRAQMTRTLSVDKFRVRRQKYVDQLPRGSPPSIVRALTTALHVAGCATRLPRPARL